jgi:hypothetical protein
LDLAIGEGEIVGRTLATKVMAGLKRTLAIVTFR